VANPRTSDGRRDLSLIRASGSTARVLNLALVFERSGGSEEFAANPLFKCQRLNQTLILKHAVRDHERALFVRPEPHTTKIVFPYSATELGIGGASVMVGEKRFETLFRNAIGASVGEADYQDDFELISLLHEMPSFDPFLMREQLRRIGRTPAKCFFDISDADITGMLDFVSREIEPLTNMAFGAAGRRAAKLSMRLSEKLMTDENAQLLEPLRETLRLAQDEYVEGVFGWKGFLYYKWLLSACAGRHDAFKPSFSGCDITCSDRGARREIEKFRQDVLRGMDLVLQRAGEMMSAYTSAFMLLTKGQPGAFRTFLLQAPGKFIPLGEAAGAVKHIHSFWGFRFPQKATPKLEAEEAQDVLQEFDRMLNGIELIRPRQEVVYV